MPSVREYSSTTFPEPAIDDCRWHEAPNTLHFTLTSEKQRAFRYPAGTNPIDELDTAHLFLVTSRHSLEDSRPSSMDLLISTFFAQSSRDFELRRDCMEQTPIESSSHAILLNNHHTATSYHFQLQPPYTSSVKLYRPYCPALLDPQPNAELSLHEPSTMRSYELHSDHGIGPKIKLYTNHGCPWAHRAHITLKELGLPYEEVIIDLTKPREPWYLEINPVSRALLHV